MPSITSKWERIIVIGCSHGHLSNPQCLDAVLSLCDRWKPKIRIHLGDFVDLAAFRSGAKGNNDEAANVAADLKAGWEFLGRFRPTILFKGNHENRCTTLLHSPNAIKAHCAQAVLSDLDSLIRSMKCRFVDNYHVCQEQSWVDIGNARFMHGFMYNEHATRDHAEAFAPPYGQIVHAHTHKPAQENGRRYDTPMAFCVGTLADIPAMEYAGSRRATLGWGHGAVIGETNHKETRLWLINGHHGPLHFPL